METSINWFGESFGLGARQGTGWHHQHPDTMRVTATVNQMRPHDHSATQA